MGKTKFCRICRTENNLKYTTKELRLLNKKQLLLAHATQQGQGNKRASKKLLLTTPTLGNICLVCDERIQIFHRLDEGGHDNCSDVEVEVVENTNNLLPIQQVDTIPNCNLHQKLLRPETPIIVDDDDMLFNIFMQKFDQKTQLQRPQTESSLSQHSLHFDEQFVRQFNTPYTPPQSTGGGSEGDESKGVEVLTSRESITALRTAQAFPPPLKQSNSNLSNSKGHRIVAIIELDDDIDENDTKCNEDMHQSVSLTPTTSCSNELSFNESTNHRYGLSPIKKHGNCTPTVTFEEDDEEIVFRKVDVSKENPPLAQKRKRKNYDEKELRLVASLSLVSSDSETEDSPIKAPVSKSSNTEAEGKSLSVVAQKFISCKDCNMKLPDTESLSVHEKIHQGERCTLCQVCFPQVKRLICHMRRKHREYNGDVLSEKPRTGQDSCMTIRLRYMQRTTFYECQLCGRIDEIFREHKEHIIEKHANESKTLKDPIMKQLKCPVCKAKCFAQYLSLCRHLISTHDYQQYKIHLRELVHVSAFGWNATRQQEVAKTAKIFQFIRRKTFFFECKICRKVVAGYLHHLRHVNNHQICSNEKTKVENITTSNELPSAKSATITSTSPLELSAKDLTKKNNVGTSKKLKKVDTKSNKLHNKAIENVNEKNKKILKPKAIDVQKSKLKIKEKEKLKQIEKHKKTIVSTKHEERDERTNESKRKINLKLQLKPKEKKNIPCGGDKLTKGKSKKDITSKKVKINENPKGKSKVKLKKTKIIPHIRQVELQKFKCKYCLKKFKGFRLYNLHILQQHKENEYTKCTTCNNIFTKSSINLQKHITQCPSILPASSKRKRKFSHQPSNSIDSFKLPIEKVPEINKNLKINVNVNVEDNNNNYRWLQDLLKLGKPSSSESISVSSLFNFKSTDTALFVPKQIILQCCYCLHVFTSDQDLEEHIKQQHSQKPEVLIKYKSFINNQQ